MDGPTEPTDAQNIEEIERPDPNDPNSPDKIIIVDEDRIPLGTYTKGKLRWDIYLCR